MFGRRENARESGSSREFSNLKDTNFLSMTFSGTKQRIGKEKKKKGIWGNWIESEAYVNRRPYDRRNLSRPSQKVFQMLIFSAASCSNLNFFFFEFSFFRPPFSCEIFEIYGALKSNKYANLAGPVRTCHVN